MRLLLVSVVLGLSVSPPARGEEVVFALEWGFGPAGSEIYWDGTFSVTSGRIVSMKAVSFETDRHDRLRSPGFRSLTIHDGTDGMEIAVEGDDATAVRLQSREGTFRWTIGRLRRTSKVRFPSRSGGALVVRMREFLGDAPRLLSDGATQDSDPAAFRLRDGRVLVLWRAFLGLPARNAAGRDRIRGTILDDQGQPGPPFDVLDRFGDVERIAVAPEGEAGARVVWAEQRDGNWDLYTRRIRIRGGAVERAEILRLTRDPGVDRAPVLASVEAGETVLAWQGWRERRSAIFCRRRLADGWTERIRLSEGPGNAWDPALAAGDDGAVAAAWSIWRARSYDVHLRVRRGGTWGPVLGIACGPRYEAHPSVAFDSSGALWVAYDEGREGWGLDSHGAGLRAVRNVRLRVVRDGRIERPTGGGIPALSGAFRDHAEMAQLARDGRGALWLFFRHLHGPGIWTLFGCALGDDGWTPPRAFRSGAGGQDVRMAAARDAAGRLLAVWPSDHRTTQVGKDSRVYASRLPERPRRVRPVEGEEVSASIPEGKPREERVRPETTLGGRTLRLFAGDLHRHTELSVCRTSSDGSLEDAHRYAIDAAHLDFLCVTDHVQHVKILNDYDIWRTGKAADLARVDGLHQPFYGYERSQRWPYGHRNIIGLERFPRRVPRTADNRPVGANSGYPGEVRVPPPELWRRLLGENVITIPHTTANPVMGTDFGSRPAAIEPVVEIYQGCRISYEYAGAPDPRRTRDGSRFGGKTREGGYIWDALAKGYRYGFIASSDHAATHNSYAFVWAERFSNRAILEALAARRVYAATDRIICDVRMGEHMMGEGFAAPRVPPLEVRIAGSAPLDRVDVIADNRIVFTHRPEKPAREARFTYRDLDAVPGTHYYYVRVIQRDRNMAWVSPIWVEVGQPSGG